MESPGYGYFSHDADVGIVGRGESVEEAFEQAARGMFALMGEPPNPSDEATAEFEFEEEDIEFAFVEWLNSVLAESRMAAIFPTRFDLRRDGSQWHGTVRGARWQGEMDLGVEVKGATLTMLSVEERGGTWEARCVVDV